MVWRSSVYPIGTYSAWLARGQYTTRLAYIFVRVLLGQTYLFVHDHAVDKTFFILRSVAESLVEHQSALGTVTDKSTFAPFRSTSQSRPNKAGLKCSSVHPYVRAYPRPSVRPQSFFDFNEIWHIGRGRWVIHVGMEYDPIKGQGEGHEPFRVGNPAFSKLSPPPFTMGAGNWPLILKLGHDI